MSVVEIVLDRPDKLNALSEEMVRSLLAQLDAAEEKGARAVLVRGEGRAFCSGRDIGDAKAGEDAKQLASAFSPLIRRVAGFPAPTFAAVQGACLGVGLGLALACDVVIAADDARFGSPFARLGGVLDSGGHAFFVERLGPHRALELIYTGRLISGREAAALGLVNRSVGRSVLLERVRAMASAVAQGPTAAFASSKRLVRRIQAEGLDLAEVLDLEAEAQGAMSQTADYREGLAAFKEKRTPRFVGK